MRKKALVIVESPSKMKTLKKILGSDYLFASSVGHIRDLPEKDFGIDVENDFEPTYALMEDKKKVIKELQQAAKECETVYLCADPDREGEAIAWHITHVLPKDTHFQRVVYYAMTKNSVLEGFDHPRDIDLSLVNAQQARRLLDRIVGYKISPLLNRKLQRGRSGFVSAGRVQSVTLKLVVDREKEIEAFKPIEYWNIGAKLTENGKKPFESSLYSVDGKRIEKEPIPGKEVYLFENEEKAQALVNQLKAGSFTVKSIEKKEKKRHPSPPFITSTLQQEASRYYGYSSTRTMKIAQQLYEGIDLGSDGFEGLITYMRTDSVHTDKSAIQSARGFIQNKYGNDFLPEKPNFYSSKKSAQEAHEAIRPTNLAHPPEKVQGHLTQEQFKLYQLVWNRFVASQMKPAIYDSASADIACTPNLILRVTGSVIKFKGFLAVYSEKNDDDETTDELKALPDLQVNQPLKLIEATMDQAFTRPPPRFTEASLIKEMEKSGIGRPSTYAATMNKIQSRDYTIKENKRLKPTELGRVIAEMLESSFHQIMDVTFTARMEDELEHIAESRKDWKELLREFWKDFLPTLEMAEKEAFVPKVPTDIDCPKCKEAKLQKVWSKSKYFFGCSRYPDCDYSAPLEELTFNKEDYAENFNWEQNCPLCQKSMIVRHGRYGTFLGCTGYPDCKGIVNIPKKGESFIPPEDLPHCPAKGCEGKLVARKSRFGKTFYSCSTYPDCDVIVNKMEDIPKKYSDHPKTPYVKKSKKKGEKGKKQATKKKTTRAQPKFKLSDELKAVTGESELTRGETTKKLWDYIKAHNLQDPNNKRIIVPDEALSKVFGSSEPIDMFKIAGLLSKHLSK